MVALVLALTAVGMQASLPLQNAISRRIEASADVHALDLTRDPQGYAEVQRWLAVSNRSDLTPAPVLYVFYATHPTAPERIALIRSWSRRQVCRPYPRWPPPSEYRPRPGRRIGSVVVARTLVVTNDFPTRQGGIEAFVLALCQRMPPAEVVVYTASMAGGREYDATLPFPVIRGRTSTLLPNPGLARRTTRVLRAEGCDRGRSVPPRRSACSRPRCGGPGRSGSWA